MMPGVTGDGNKLQGGAGGAAGPATSGSGAMFSTNGWTVSTGSSKASGGNAAAGLPWWVYLGGGVLLLVGVVAWKKYS